MNQYQDSSYYNFSELGYNSTMPLSGYNVDLDQPNFATSDISYINQSTISNTANFLQLPPIFTPMPNDCYSCGKPLVYNVATQSSYCNDCISHQGITGQGIFLHGGESSSNHRYNIASEQGQSITISPLSTSNCEGKQQTPSVSQPSFKKRRGLSRNKDRKVNDRAYTRSKNDIYKKMARLIEMPLPEDFEFSKEQSKKNKCWSIKGILQNVAKCIEGLRVEKEELKQTLEKLEDNYKELQKLHDGCKRGMNI